MHIRQYGRVSDKKKFSPGRFPETRLLCFGVAGTYGGKF